MTPEPERVMPQQDVWPPPPSDQPPPPRRPGFVWPNTYVLILAVAASLADAWRDIHQAGFELFDFWDLAVVFSLAVLQPRYAWLWAIIQALCMMMVHVAAIQGGYKAPYVENYPIEAVWDCSADIVPNLAVAYVAVGLRAAAGMMWRPPEGL